ncbi:MAG: TfoX/Sxy family protein, partial [Xanthobacteraceae bacterium]
MSYDEKAAERVRRVLAGGQELAEMMGAICFMVSGNMCCGVTGSALMVRVGREAYQRTLAEPHVRPMEMVVAGDRLASCWSTGRATAPTRRLPMGQARHGFR